jgi:hypothetical protein
MGYFQDSKFRIYCLVVYFALCVFASTLMYIFIKDSEDGKSCFKDKLHGGKSYEED